MHAWPVQWEPAGHLPWCRGYDLLGKGWMDIAFAADGRCISEMLCCCLNDLHDIFLSLGLGIKSSHFLQRFGYSDRTTPGTEIFGGEALIRDLMQVFVYVVRLNFAQLPVFVDVLEELVSRQILAALDDFGKLTVPDIDDVLFAPLATKMELDFCSCLNVSRLYGVGCDKVFV